MPSKHLITGLIILAPLFLACQNQARSAPAPASQSPQVQEPDISTILMQSTFEIAGPVAGSSRGTCFIVAKPAATNPSSGSYVLVTAAHVLDSITSQQAVLFARQRHGDDWKKVPMPLRIRNEKNAPLWVRNPHADVAAMYVGFPAALKPASIVSTALFVEDRTLKEFEVRPGDRVFVLGYPFGLDSSSGGFPILRAGWIASYPLLPSRSVGKFLISFKVFKGNSGGPVYLIDYNRFYQGGTHIGVVHFFIGLVSEEMLLTQQQRGPYSSTTQQYPLDVAVVIPASLIADTIGMLPAPPQPSTP